jgi:hypothetical protein
MRITRSRAFWLSFAAGSAFAATLAVIGRSRYRRRSAPQRRRPDVEDCTSRLRTWRFNDRIATLPAGHTLRIELSSPGMVHWTANQWDAVEDTRTTEIAPGVHVADLATEALPTGARLQFTFYWPAVNRWEGGDFEMRVGAPAGELARTALGKQG